MNPAPGARCVRPEPTMPGILAVGYTKAVFHYIKGDTDLHR
jgi:hypothetical protein